MADKTGDQRLADAGLLALVAGQGADQADRQAFYLAATDGLVAPDLPAERQLAADIMQLYGVIPAARVRSRRGAMLVRAASAVRAAGGQPKGLRHLPGPDDLAVSARRYPYLSFFAVEEMDFAFRRFDGTMSRSVTREVFVGCDAVTVLPYDPARDRVLLIEQMRAAPLARGDANPWQLEPIAGRIDAGETPEAAARREAVEEAGLELGALEQIAGYYPTTAAFSEYLYSYVALCDLPDGVAGVFGVADEAEDIRGHVLPFDQAMARLDAGEISNAPLILSLNWLWRHRDRLRGI